jgi:DnaJ-domain-containing protein 1
MKKVRIRCKEIVTLEIEQEMTNAELKFLENNLESSAVLAPYTGILADITKEAHKIDSAGFTEVSVEEVNEHDSDRLLSKHSLVREIVIIDQEIKQIFKSGKLDTLSLPELGAILHRFKISRDIINKYTAKL